jgi:hypothetical protein
MKIIDIAICVDNIDPKGIGRIRCVRYNDYVGEKEKALKYDKWGDLDPFIAMPFLPNNINMIPEIGQSVKVLNYNSDKETVNQEYIAGPFTTMYDYNSQNFSQQIENTTYGVAVKRRDGIRKVTGEYIEKNSEYVFAKERDYGIYGKYGSDILFTENGLELRGGKLLSKDAANTNNRKKLISTPIYTSKQSKLHLKKYPKSASLVDLKRTLERTENVNLNYIIEYEIDSLTTPTEINIYAYKIINDLGGLYKTDNFNDNTPISIIGDAPALKLINLDNSLTGATHTIVIDPEGNKTTLAKNIAIEIRNIINQLSQSGLSSLNQSYDGGDIHPFYFRATENFKIYTGTTEELSFKDLIFNGIKVRNIGPSNGLIWSQSDAVQPPKTYELSEKIFKYENDSKEQTFASLTSDRILLLSTDANETDLKIDFDALDKYEYSHENYIKDIEPNTYATVRGENLLKFLEALYVVLITHRHNLLKPYARTQYEEHNLLERLFNNLKNDILNNSIRIN